MYFAEISVPSQSELHFDVEYDVVRPRTRRASRQPAHRRSFALIQREAGRHAARRVGAHHRPSCPKLALKVTQGKTHRSTRLAPSTTTSLRPCAMTRAAPLGRGDVLYACDAKKGNCTDFHSLFIAMARSQSIPARFEIWLPNSAGQASAEIAGYHCCPISILTAKAGFPWISRGVEASGEARLLLRLT